ncbi:hypothetical protein NQ318_022017 [Aromia moschata]|uniref:Uncharacterized protein n=1 Tax=Aromia moschata TaxID=1265417 RepID=A0AAV8Z6D1_9CUCU|nr:hypothetical protein NQ318_022017 [Aromia moschata]
MRTEPPHRGSHGLEWGKFTLICGTFASISLNEPLSPHFGSIHFRHGKSQNQNLLYNKLEVNVKEDFFQCYDCNSEYDKRCGDPFDPYTIGKINCSQRSAPEHLTDPLHMDQKIEPVLCRKIVQKRPLSDYVTEYYVTAAFYYSAYCASYSWNINRFIVAVEGNVRVIRGCGYIKDPHDDKKCFRRTGTSAVEVIHCSCTKKIVQRRSVLSTSNFYSVFIGYNLDQIKLQALGMLNLITGGRMEWAMFSNRAFSDVVV